MDSDVTYCKGQRDDRIGRSVIGEKGSNRPDLSRGSSACASQCQDRVSPGATRIILGLVASLLVYLTIEMSQGDPARPLNRPRREDQSILAEVMLPKTNMRKLLNEAVIIKQDDPDLIKMIRDEYIDPPSEEPYNLYNPRRRDNSKGQSMTILHLLNKMRDGFFLEYGVFEGELQSNTLVFESLYNWSGVVVEENPGRYKLFKKKNRKVYSVQAGLSSVSFPGKTKVQVHRRTPPNPTDEEIKKTKVEMAEVQRFPIYSILLALGNPTVHYVSLRDSKDLLDILHTIPWKKVDIWTLTVEHRRVPGGAPAIQKYMKENGYKVFTKVPPFISYITYTDSFFVREDIYNSVANTEQLKTMEEAW